MVITKLYGKSWRQRKIPWSLHRPCIGLGKLQQHLTPCATVSAGRASLLITLPFSLNSYPGVEPCTMLPQAWKHQRCPQTSFICASKELLENGRVSPPLPFFHTI